MRQVASEGTAQQLDQLDAALSAGDAELERLSQQLHQCGSNAGFVTAKVAM
jgi:hypothetical protein